MIMETATEDYLLYKNVMIKLAYQSTPNTGGGAQTII
jgi:hypothetical protein